VQDVVHHLSKGERIMKLKIVLIVLLAVACLLVGQLWTLWVQPELMTDLALSQMERSDEAAQLMRTASQAQHWPATVMGCVFVVGALLILVRGRSRPSASSSAGNQQPTREEVQT
jgi:hypothetical protein